MDCSLPGISVHGIFQARVLEWVAISFSRGSSQPRGWTLVSHIAGRHFTVWATTQGSHHFLIKKLKNYILTCQWFYLRTDDTLVSPALSYALGEGNGTPLPYSCLENPMDGGAWWAAIYGVAQSQTRLKWQLQQQQVRYRSQRIAENQREDVSYNLKYIKIGNLLWFSWEIFIKRTL